MGVCDPLVLALLLTEGVSRRSDPAPSVLLRNELVSGEFDPTVLDLLMVGVRPSAVLLRSAPIPLSLALVCVGFAQTLRSCLQWPLPVKHSPALFCRSLAALS